jgi:Carboxypeptidase activation peptide
VLFFQIKVIDLWLDPKSSKRKRCDFMVMPSNLERVLERLNETNIKSKIMINDLQRLIDNENPSNMTIPTQDYSFRTGKCYDMGKKYTPKMY